MVRITSKAFHEKLTAPGKEDIILNGSPRDLRGTMRISNTGPEILKVRSLPLHTGKGKKAAEPAAALALKVSAKLHPGEERTVNLSHQMHPNTAPGTYESTMMIGGLSRKVTLVVQQNMEIELFPTHFTFAGTAPGVVHEMIMTLTNLGNVPFSVPEIKHIAALDMDMICTALGLAIRDPKSEGYEALLDGITKNIKANLPDWAEAQVTEVGMVLAPGESRLIHIRITIPRNAKPNKDYYGNMRFWDKDISYSIKSSNDKLK